MRSTDFPEKQIYCVLDYETYSEADLKACGAQEYSRHPSTEIMCMAWRIGTKKELKSAPTKAYCSYLEDHHDLSTFFQALLDPKVVLVAHNAGFEQAITKNVFATKLMYSKKKEIQAIPISRWLCTSALAAALALPRNLEEAAFVLNLPVQKDMAGRRLMLKMSKPKKPSKKDPSRRHLDPSDFEDLVAYCKKDVDTEVELFLKAPPLHPFERKIWELDQKINQRGVLVDRKLVTTIIDLIDRETRRLNREVEEETMGLITSPNQMAAIQKWLADDGVYLPNLQKDTVELALERGYANGISEKLLRFRQAGSKTSTSKYKRFESGTRTDSRIRDNLKYHAAATGRWGGGGVQLQNLPRPKLLKAKDVEFVLKILHGKW